LASNLAAQLPALLADPERVVEIPVEAIPATIAQLSALIGQLSTRQLDANSSPPSPSSASHQNPQQDPDAWLTVEQASEQYPVSKSWLYRNARKRGFATKMGAKLLVSRRRLERFLDRGTHQ
jgi:hypothetical protein